jgi:hypothetical protein
MLESALERLGARAPMARANRDLAPQPPGPCEAEVVADLFKGGDRPSGYLRNRSARIRRSGEGLVELAFDQRSCFDVSVAVRNRSRQRFVEDGAGTLEVPHHHQRAAELGQQRGSLPIVRRKEAYRAGDETRCG